MISMVIRFGVSFIQKLTGVTVVPTLALEYATENWMRNGWLRINPPALSLIIVPILVYMIYENKQKRRRYFFCLGVVLFYSMFIHGARSLILYQLIEIVFLVLYKRKSTKTQMVVFAFLAIAGMILVNSEVGNAYINSFLPGGEFEGSTTGRLEAIGFYLASIQENFWTGTGFLSFEERQFVGEIGYVAGTLEDVGVLYSVVQVGAGIIGFYLMFLFRNIYIARRIKHNNEKSNSYLLVAGITLSVFLTTINIDMFYGIYVLAVPFGLAICEFVSKQYAN